MDSNISNIQQKYDTWEIVPKIYKIVNYQYN